MKYVNGYIAINLLQLKNLLFHDFIYMPVSARLQNRFRFAKGDAISFSGRFAVQEGTMVIRQARGIEVVERGEQCFWTESRARVAQRTGSLLDRQEEKCYACDKGVLLHMGDDALEVRGARRKMFCRFTISTSGG